MKRMLVYMDAKSSKFWNIEVTGCEHTVCFGRTGTSGQSKTKSFPDARAALKDAEKSISAKLKKGYVEAEEPAAEGDIPFVAFSNVVRINDIYSNVATFVGKRVVDYDPEKTAQENVVYRFRSNWDEESLIPHLTHFMATPSARDCKALVVGAWQGDDSSVDSGDVSSS